MNKRGFPGGSIVKNLPVNAGAAGDSAFMPGSGRSPGGGNGNPLQDYCLKNPIDRSLAGYSPKGYQGSDVAERLNNNNKGTEKD